MSTDRRRFLHVVGATAIGGLAGCSGSDDQSETETAADDTAESSPTVTKTQTREQQRASRPTQVARLTGEQDTLGFGREIATSRVADTALISSGEHGSEGGEVWVFSRENGSWAQTTTLRPNKIDAEDALGYSIALSKSGTTALIGAPKDNDPHGTTSGSVWAYELDGNSWELGTTLTAVDGAELDNFGGSIGLSADGTKAVIGAAKDNNSNGDAAGSAYVFAKAGGEWTQRTKILATDGSENASFGRSIELTDDGTTALIGAPDEGRMGAAYVFAQDNGQWQQQSKLTAPAEADVSTFGHAVELTSSANTALVSAPRELATPQDAGPVYVYSNDGGTWSRQSRLDPQNGSNKSLFGSSVALLDGGSVALVGVPDQAKASVFTQRDDTWSEQGELVPENGDGSSGFGDAIEPFGESQSTLIGAPADEARDYGDAGSVYVFDF